MFLMFIMDGNLFARWMAYNANHNKTGPQHYLRAVVKTNRGIEPKCSCDLCQSKGIQGGKMVEVPDNLLGIEPGQQN